MIDWGVMSHLTDEIDVIVTDRDARPDLLAAFTERGIRVITA